MKVDLIILLQQRNPILQRNTLGKINLKKTTTTFDHVFSGQCKNNTDQEWNCRQGRVCEIA